jgi:hypothetical protein
MSLAEALEIDQRPGAGMLCEEARTELIAAIAALVRDENVPEPERSACLTVIGYLARRMPGEGASTVGVCEMQARACASRGSSRSG